jgi:hypothetical protein
MNFLQKISGKISDAIPNEFSKLNSWNKYNPEPVSRSVIGLLSGADRFGETYSNSEDGGIGGLMDAGQYGMSAFGGNSGDPNLYSPKNQQGFASGDWALTAGRAGDLLGGDFGQIPNSFKKSPSMEALQAQPQSRLSDLPTNARISYGRGLSPSMPQEFRKMGITR